MEKTERKGVAMAGANSVPEECAGLHAAYLAFRQEPGNRERYFSMPPSRFTSALTSYTAVGTPTAISQSR